MKQTQQSDTPHDSDLESPASSDRASKSHRMIPRRGNMIKGMAAILSVSLLVLIYVLAKSNHPRGGEAENIPVESLRLPEVEVLDGAGSMRAAQQLTNIIRARGYDVVEMKKNNGEEEDRTLILDRSGNLEAARKLAAALGVPQDKVFQKIDRSLYLDITVVLGKDYNRLKAFQSSLER